MKGLFSWMLPDHKMRLILVLLVSSMRTVDLESEELDNSVIFDTKIQEGQELQREQGLQEGPELPEEQARQENQELPEEQGLQEGQVLQEEQGLQEGQELQEEQELTEQQGLQQDQNITKTQGLLVPQKIPDAQESPGTPAVQQLNESNNQTKFFAWTWLSAHLFSTTTKPHQQNNPTYDYCNKCLCGVPNLTKRIVGGNETKLLQFPWMAALMNGQSFFCGGSLITDRHVLTAAHCTSTSMRNLIVKLLEHDRASSFETTTLIRRVKSVVVYPQYDPELYDNDIAILRLDEPVNITSELRPICLPTSNSSFAGRTGIVTGWGALMEGGTTSTKLQQVSVPIMTLAACRRHYVGGSITENMMCAGYREGGKDACQGDSGGPFHFYNVTIARYQQIGVVSWGEGCARPNKPGVYTRVNRFMTWIRNTTKGGCYCNN